MLRLKTQLHDVKDDYLSLPNAQPLTLLQVSSENLPYACQCPLCGGIFEIPKGILYEIEEDDIPDTNSGVEPTETRPESGFFGDDQRPPAPQEKSNKVEEDVSEMSDTYDTAL